MTNFERYKDKIKDIMASGKDVCKEFIQPIMLKEDKCDGIACVHCGLQQMLWLMDEYEEPGVDWSEIALDTLCMVRTNKSTDWYPRYFAGIDQDGVPRFWSEGRTSYTKKSDNDFSYWSNYRLAEEGE